ncbi:MAG: SHOCT domain-containing protein [Acidimicrobiia bacterium]
MKILSTITLAGGPGEWGPGWAPGGGGPWWLVFPLLWIVLIGTVIWLIARDRRRQPSSVSPSQRATEILASRYARGEIDTEEYHQRLDEIRELS